MDLYLKAKTTSARGIGNEDIPAGSIGRVIDILVEDDGHTMFCLEFDDGDVEWYASDSIEACDHATER